jgi:hypothetical protein
MINEGINKHPLKRFEDKDQEVVEILVEACGTKQNVHGIEVFILKRYIMGKQSWALIIIENNGFMARRTWLTFERGWRWMSSFTRKPR